MSTLADRYIFLDTFEALDVTDRAELRPVAEGIEEVLPAFLKFVFGRRAVLYRFVVLGLMFG